MSAEMLETISPRSTHDAAVQFAHYGWSVFPCKPDKRPYTAHGFHDASRDERQIDAWWRQWPDALIGIACGASGLVVLDYDPDKDPDGWGLAALEDLIGETETRAARTGRGGKHFYFRANPETPVRNSASDLAPGLDVRADGGYVIAPPSVSEHGEYTWLNRAAPAPMTPAIIEAATEPAKKPRESAGVPSAPEDAAIPQGRRNETLASIAGTLQRRGMSPLAIEQALLIENAEHCSPPLTDEDVRRIAHSIGRYPASAPVTEPVPASAEPEAEILSEDAVSVRLTLANGVGARFVFAHMEQEKRSLYCDLSLSFFGVRGGPKEVTINLTSNSARTELRRELEGDYGKDFGWGIALSTAFSLAKRSFLGQDLSVAVRDIPLLAGERDLIRPIMPLEGTTIIFGSPASTKSYIANALALAGRTGEPFAGRFTVPSANVLYLDFEDRDTNYRARVRRILHGTGRSDNEIDGIYYWGSRGKPLRDRWEAVRRSCDLHDIGWIVVDSAGFACGGQPEDAETAIALFAAIERIGRPCLMIAHVTKTGDERATQKPFGSAFYEASARRTWYVAHNQDEDSDELRVALHCRKTNEGRKPAPIGIQVSFEEEGGPVRFQTFSLSGDVELDKHASLSDRIWRALEHPMTTKDLGDLLDCHADVIAATLRRSKFRFAQVGEMPSETGRPPGLWARAARPTDEGVLF